MKKEKGLISMILLLLITMTSSCGLHIEKRRYQKGFFIERSNRGFSKKNVVKLNDEISNNEKRINQSDSSFSKELPKNTLSFNEITDGDDLNENEAPITSIPQKKTIDNHQSNFKNNKSRQEILKQNKSE